MVNGKLKLLLDRFVCNIPIPYFKVGFVELEDFEAKINIRFWKGCGVFVIKFFLNFFYYTTDAFFADIGDCNKTSIYLIFRTWKIKFQDLYHLS